MGDRCRRAGEVCAVTLYAVRVYQLIIAVGMARLAGLCGMSTGQREPRRAVIERGRLPCRRVVAGRTVLAEITCDMVWVRRVLIVRLMALVTVREGQLVVAIDVTRLTLKRRVRSRERKSCTVMIERRR
jgi:hypothetical protein